MKSNLKQHVASIVKDIIPLGVPQLSSANETSTSRLVPHRLSQDTGKKHVNTLEVSNPQSKHMQQSTSALSSSSGSKKGSGRVQNNFFNCNVLMRKLQLNNNNNCASKDGSHQAAAKKGVLLQRTSSYEKEREFALALCKQLNENLKVGKTMLHSGNTQQWSPLSPPPVSRPPSESTSSAPQRQGSIPGSSVEQESQDSVKKEDSKPCQATTPNGGLSLKRRREFSSDEKHEGKRFCQKDSHQTPTSARVSSSTEAHDISSPPKYVRCAILKTSSEKGSVILEDRKKTSTSLSSSLSRTLFKEPVREPRSECLKPQSVTPTPNVPRIGHVKEEAKQCNDSNFQVGNSLVASTSSSPSWKPNQNCSDGRSSPVSSHTNMSPGLMDEVKICSSLQKSELKASVSFGPTGSEKDETEAPNQDPDTSPRASLASTHAGKDEEKKKGMGWNDFIDLELSEDEDLRLESCALSLSSSGSSDEEQLLSLQEILERSARIPATPEKGEFSEPSTPVPKAPEEIKRKVTSYKNTMEQMLKEKEQNQKSKELEMQLLQTCKEDLLKLEEDEEIENTEAALSHEQREFLQKFSVTSCAIRDIHPGEEVFTLANFGRLFNHLSLDLTKIGVIPNNRAQQTLLKAHTEQVLLLLSAGLFRRAYSATPCQPQVTLWLFQMMSVHPNPSTCVQILQTMKTIALSAAQHIVENSNKKFEVWVPSLQDIALVFLNMGVSFVSLFSLEALQPSFTEGDLLESLQILSDGTRTEKERNSFPEHNFENIIKYLALCAALCPRAYTDEELLLLLVLVCKVSLETYLQLLPTGDLSCLLQHILNNMTHWEIQLPQVCQAITDLTEDHHNLRRLVQLLPCCSRGKQLRRHLSVSVISKLLNQKCTYKPSCSEFQLSDLRSYLPRMRPSSLLKGFIAAQKEQKETDVCALTLDQQAYYLCYSLLALTNEASNFEFLPSNQRNELLLLSAELEKHIKCDIRESEKMLYRSKVKDFVARIYTRWQVLLQRSRPQEGKLYDYWKPLPEDELPINEERHSTEYPKQEAAEEPQSEDSDSVHSEDEEWVEEEDEVPAESEEELEECVTESEEKKDEVQGVLSDIKEERQLIELGSDDKKEDVRGDTLADKELLEGERLEDLTESDVDEELLKDEESVEKGGDLLVKDDDEPEEDKFL